MTSNNFYKNYYSKSCRAAEEFCRFSIEGRVGRDSNAGGTGGVIVPEKPSSLSIAMGFSADPASSQGKSR